MCSLCVITFLKNAVEFIQCHILPTHRKYYFEMFKTEQIPKQKCKECGKLVSKTKIYCYSKTGCPNLKKKKTIEQLWTTCIKHGTWRKKKARLIKAKKSQRSSKRRRNVVVFWCEKSGWKFIIFIRLFCWCNHKRLLIFSSQKNCEYANLSMKHELSHAWVCALFFRRKSVIHNILECLNFQFQTDNNTLFPFLPQKASPFVTAFLAWF